MATYEYRCEQDGLFDIIRPLGTAAEFAPCPVCSSPSRRALSMPMVRRTSQSAWFAAIEHADKSRYEPEVVAQPPPVHSRRPGLQMTPALWSLPRP